MSHTIREIQKQPADWQETIDTVAAQFSTLSLDIKAYDTVMFTGCGTSYYIAIAAARMFQEAVSMPAHAVPASEIMLDADTVISDKGRTLLVGLSRSGTTTETVKALETFREKRYGTALSISCRANSLASQAADKAIELPHVHEDSVVMTGSFTNLLLATQWMSASLSADTSYQEQLRQLPGLGQQVLEASNSIAEKIGRDKRIKQFIYLGFGAYYGIASEAVLKLKEMTQTPTEAYNPLEFRHGPISIVNDDTLVVLMQGHRASAYQTSVLRDVKELGGRTLLVSPEPSTEFTPDEALYLPDQLSDMARAILYLPFVQLIGYYRALALDYNPDTPRNLSQVVTL